MVAKCNYYSSYSCWRNKTQ